MDEKRILNSTAILVSCGGPNNKAGIVICSGSLVYIPAIDEIPETLQLLARLEAQKQIRCIGENKPAGHIILQPVEVNHADVAHLAELFTGDSYCEVCGSIMVNSSESVRCINCGNTRGK